MPKPIEAIARSTKTRHNHLPMADEKRNIAYTKPVFDESEIDAVLEVLKKGWLGMKDKAEELEASIARKIGTTHCRLCNSGSSANLLAISALELPRGSEVITPACTFPTTINPLIQNNLVPVLVEVTTGFVLDAEKVEQAVSEKTKAIMVPQLLGNVANMDLLTEIAEKHDLVIIEDCCDAFESRWNGKNCGTFGKAGTYSLYASHHFTAAGEGGALVTSDKDYYNLIQQYRDWGRRGTWGWDESTRFDVSLSDGTPFDERYYFRNIGYNLKMTEIQAAFALKQMARLDGFRERRVTHFQKLYGAFREQFSDFFELVTWHEKADPAWFVFPFLVQESAPFTRNEAIGFFNKWGVEGRTLFVGNILLHPAYQHIEHRVADDLSFSNQIAKRGMFIGIGPQMEPEDLDYIVEVTRKLCTQ
ncbi:lipopolysaccharide biosynthesis protein RfbH [Candidatus Peregrinibacteria bacterium CG10_big_fil_rev_8_21_14_0_10_49_10]|nr:MAG: lipopolysaccharide biosynthesis protein RfbH [Candidatus Peregrinibacteria bacterium CG10_big_fil_rev_8_21_14_0_10_49_10]